MGTHQQTLEWFRQLGYDGNFPESFDKICNSTTSFIWDQLFHNVRSKIEVDNIKSNILVHHLKRNGLASNKPYQSECSEEISAYLKKRDLEQNVAVINYSITEKQALNQSLMEQNSIKQFTIERINLKIKENEEREYLLREKIKVLDMYKEEAENIFNFSMTCAPAEVSEVNNPNDITETFNACKETLEEKIKQLLLSGSKTSSGVMYRPSVRKTARKNSIFEHYFCLTEKRTAKKTKRIVGKAGAASAHKINVRLFPDDGDKINTKPMKFMDLSNRRESLEMYIEDNDDENFLVDLSKASLMPSLLDFKNSSSSLSIMHDMNRSNGNCQMNNETLLKLIYNDSVATDLTQLLHKYSRDSIWNIFRYLDNDIHFHISKKINFKDVEISNDSRQKSAELARLQALHVKTEFKLIKNNIVLRQLIEKVNKKNERLISLLNSDYPADLKDGLQKNLQLHVEDAGLECLLREIKKEINEMQTFSKITNNHKLNETLREIKKEITFKTNDLNRYFKLIQEVFTVIHSIRNRSSSCVREVGPFTSDLSWCYLLEESVNSNELKIFEQFPLEYNRKFINTNPSLYYRDFHTDKYLLNNEINNENLNMLSRLLGNPFNPPETVIFNILCSKLKLEALKNIKCVENRIPHKKQSIKNLQSKERTADAMEELNKIICSSTSKKTLSAADVSTQIMSMWSEMNFYQYISPKIKVDGKDYKHFEIEYDRYFSGL